VPLRSRACATASTSTPPVLAVVGAWHRAPGKPIVLVRDGRSGVLSTLGAADGLADVELDVEGLPRADLPHLAERRRLALIAECQAEVLSARPRPAPSVAFQSRYGCVPLGPDVPRPRSVLVVFRPSWPGTCEGQRKGALPISLRQKRSRPDRPSHRSSPSGRTQR